VTARWLWSAFWCVLGVLIAWQSHAVGLGTFAEPGPGMLSFGLGIAMALVGAGRAFASREVRAEPQQEFPWRVVALSALLAVYFLLLVPAGYVLSTFVLMLALLRGFSGLRWVTSVPLALLASIASYAIFKIGLGVQLPAGLLA